MYYFSPMGILSLATIVFFFFGSVIGLKDYSITAFKKVPDSSHSYLFILQTSLKKCVRACVLRPWCNVITYRRRYSLCELFENLDWQTLERGTDIVITKNDIRSKEMDQCQDLCPINESGQSQTCDLEVENCLETGCISTPSVENGNIVGDVHLEGSKMKVDCNQGYEPLPGMAYCQCENGTWTNALKCARECETGWEQNGTSQYCFSHSIGKFTFAEPFCAERGAEILNIENESEQSYIHGKLTTFFRGKYIFTCVYVGMEADNNRTWRYSASLEEVTYFNWFPSQPDGSPENLNVALIPYFGWQWGDISASWTCNIVCERKTLQTM